MINIMIMIVNIIIVTIVLIMVRITNTTIIMIRIKRPRAAGALLRGDRQPRNVALSAADTLYDVPVSNNGARVRLIAYAKGLDDSALKIESPGALGGLKSPEYTALNPQGKMPLLVGGDGLRIYESDTIARYIIDVHSGQAPSFVPSTPEARALDNMIARVHDIYLTTIQGCMYKATPPFGPFQSRWEALAEVKKQVRIINDLASDEGPFLSGKDIGLSDASLFPTMVFMRKMLPLFMQPG